MSYVNPTIEEIERRRSDLAPFDKINEGAFMALWATITLAHGMPETYLDLGSGTGAMVNMARKIGIEAYGVDVINGPEDWFIHHDLTRPLEMERMTRGSAMFDLITCLEVAEHLPKTAENVLVETISRHLNQGGILVFSAALPGQSGEHHVNLRPPWYWRDLCYEAGVSYRADYTGRLSHLWSLIAGPAMWLWANVQVFDT